MSHPVESNKSLSPRPLMRLLGDFGSSQILNAALEFDFFTHIHAGLHTSDEIARRAGTDPRATRIVLDSLIALGLIDKRQGEYFLCPISEAFLVRGKASYMGDFRHVALALWDGMAHLKETLKTGKPLGRMDTGTELEAWEKLVVGIIPIVEPVAKALWDILAVGTKRRGLRVLDIAGGSSVFGMSLLQRDASSHVTQLDWANVNEVAKKLNRQWGLEGKIRYINGEFQKAAVEENHYDLVITSNFCRFQSPRGNRELFLKAHRALKPGGLLAINDCLPNEDRTGPSFPLRFSVYTLTHTPEGESYTYSQYSRWLADAGFSALQRYGDIAQTLPGTTLILAGKV